MRSQRVSLLIEPLSYWPASQRPHFEAALEKNVTIMQMSPWPSSETLFLYTVQDHGLNHARDNNSLSTWSLSAPSGLSLKEFPALPDADKKGTLQVGLCPYEEKSNINSAPNNFFIS